MLRQMLLRVAGRLRCLRPSVWYPCSLTVAAAATLFVSVLVSGCYRTAVPSFPQTVEPRYAGHWHTSALARSAGQVRSAQEGAASPAYGAAAYQPHGPYGPQYADVSGDLTEAYGIGNASAPPDAPPSGIGQHRVGSNGSTPHGVASTASTAFSPGALLTRPRDTGGLDPSGTRYSDMGGSLSLSPLDSSVIPDGPGCLAMLDSLGVHYEIAPLKPNMRTAVLVSGPLGGVTYQGYAPGAMLCDCRLAVALSWLGPDFAAIGITAVRYSGAYVNRMSRVGRLSMHAWGLAIDIHEVILPTGREVVLRDYVKGLENPCMSSKPLNQLVCRMRARRIFRELLTPDYDADHNDHLHVSIRVHGDDPVGAKLYQASKAPKATPSKPHAVRGKRSVQLSKSAVAESGKGQTAGSKASDGRVSSNQAAKVQVAKDQAVTEKQANSQLDEDEVAKGQSQRERVTKEQVVKDQPTKDKAQKKHMGEDQASKDSALTGLCAEIARADKTKEPKPKGKSDQIEGSGASQGVGGGADLKGGKGASDGGVSDSKDATRDKSRTKDTPKSARADAEKAPKAGASSSAEAPGVAGPERTPEKTHPKGFRKRGKARVRQPDAGKDKDQPSSVPLLSPPPPNVRAPNTAKRPSVS